MGWNREGQLGDGTRVNSSRPIILPQLKGVVSVGAGWNYSAAVTERGQVFTWGDGSLGQLGNGAREPHQLMPLPIDGVNDAVSVSCGEHHTAIVHLDGGLSTFGGSYNYHGELGHGDDIHFQLTPRRVRGIEKAVAAACGDNHTVVQHADDRVSTFGGGTRGQLGLGPGIVRTSVPRFVDFE
jgi:alpha-tubulin suppressor-like RCC1 family protein